MFSGAVAGGNDAGNNRSCGKDGNDDATIALQCADGDVSGRRGRDGLDALRAIIGDWQARQAAADARVAS